MQYSKNANIVSVAVVGLNEKIIFSLFLKHVGLLINIFCIYTSSSGIEKRDACSSYILTISKLIISKYIAKHFA